MLNYLESYLVKLYALHTKLMPLAKEAFGEKGWSDAPCVTSWMNTNEATRATEGHMRVALWLYIPNAASKSVSGFSQKTDGGSMEALKDANAKQIKALKELAANRQQTVAKADFYNQVASELITIDNELVISDM